MTSRARSSADAAAARLGGRSRLVADQLEGALPAMRAAFGTDLAAWLELVERVAHATAPGPGATLALLRLDPERVRRTGLAVLARWVDATAAIGVVAPPLAAAYVEATAALVGSVDAAWLDALARETLALRSGGGWRGDRVAQVFVAAAPRAATSRARPKPSSFRCRRWSRSTKASPARGWPRSRASWRRRRSPST